MLCIFICDTDCVQLNCCSFNRFNFVQHSIHTVAVFVMIAGRHFVDCNFVKFVSHLDFDCSMMRIVVDKLVLVSDNLRIKEYLF